MPLVIAYAVAVVLIYAKNVSGIAEDNLDGMGWILELVGKLRRVTWRWWAVSAACDGALRDHVLLLE